MALTQAQRERGWRWWVDHRAAVADPGPARFTKPELRAAADAVEAWLVANQASYVVALAGTAFAGAGSTTDEKVRLLVAVAAAKYDVEV